MFIELALFCFVFPFLYLGQIFSQSNQCQYEYIGGGVLKSEADFIVQKHNDLRILIANGKVEGQPRGTNLKRLKWDDQLAEKAQSIADTCIYKHVKVTDNRWPIGVGQNLYIKKSTKFVKDTDWDRAIQKWFNEHKKYNFSKSTKRATGHYTQVIWATTEYVGCGYTFFETKDKMKYQKLYVCNYGPGGNIRGVFPYHRGQRGCENLC